MRSLEDTRKRWQVAMPCDSFATDLRQTVRDTEGPNPCQNGLRSVYWKAFLLYGPLNQSSWPKKVSDSRNAYSSLRDHFLKYIDHPNDLQSSVDPLADDDNSPWTCLRQDETDREEIFQDVERCMQEKFFFRKLSTQKKLLDILFMYSKLNPDIGYRQGMHELLAPILWVVDCDAVDPESAKTAAMSEEVENESMMLEILDPDFVEHDAFNLFCALMQTAKAFYEVGDSKTSPLVNRSRRIQKDLLAAVDPELEQHLVSIEILPQIYLVRWIRLLFGREFGFDAVLSLWDLLFSKGLSLGLVDMTCVVMLLRIRWQLLDADYTTALSLLLHYSLPPSPGGIIALVEDAEYLDHNRSPEAGASVVERYSSQRLETKVAGNKSGFAKGGLRPFSPHIRRQERGHIPLALSPSPNRLSASLLSQQRGLEALFQEVYGEVQRRTEGWSIAKAVKGAVGEVKRNVQNLQQEASGPSTRKDLISRQQESDTSDHRNLTHRIQELQERSKVLAKMLGTALESLRQVKECPVNDKPSINDESFNLILAKLQFVQMYLADPEIPIPAEVPRSVGSDGKEQTKKTAAGEIPPVTGELSLNDELRSSARTTGEERSPTVQSPEAMPAQNTNPNLESKVMRHTGFPPARQQRPSLAESSFSFMVGEGRHESGFVSSASAPPEERRGRDPKTKPKQAVVGERDIVSKEPQSEDDGFNMSSLRGFERRR